MIQDLPTEQTAPAPDQTTPVGPGGVPLLQDQRREAIQLDLLLEGINKFYGFDFRDYARPSLLRRIPYLLEAEGLSTISQLQGRILHDERAMARFLQHVTINVTEMFRDPQMYRSFLDNVVPILRTYPSIRIWHAGCSTGEEVYSLAILLSEVGLLSKAKIYATDIDEAALKSASSGIISLRSMQTNSRNYVMAGGKNSLSDYYTAKYESARIKESIWGSVIFSRHNLATDHSFNDFNVIFCRNVLIYFNETLQERAHELIYTSLRKFGFLITGDKENISGVTQEHLYRTIDADQRIYQRSS